MNMQMNQVEIGRALLDCFNAHDLGQWEALIGQRLHSQLSEHA